MAIRHSITLSTSEPNNEVGNLKIRQGDEQTQTLVANITENGVPKPFVGLQPFFCAKLGQTAGLGIIEQKVTGTMNPANGTLEYVMQPEDWQQLGRQTAYFSFRKMVNDHEWTEQFSTRDFNYNVIKSAFSEGLREVKKDGSTYVWTIEDMVRLFKEYISTGKTDWEEFVEQNREILESVDPGGIVLRELLDARNPFGSEAYQTLGERLGDSDNKLSTINKNVDNKFKKIIHMTDYVKSDGLVDATDLLQQALNDNIGKTIYWDNNGKAYITRQLNIPSNTHIVFSPTTKIRSAEGYGTHERVFNLSKVDNVVIEGNFAEIRMNKGEYLTGEHRHCMTIFGCHNIKINNLLLCDSGGDGIIIGGATDSSRLSQNIFIYGVTCDNNRRQGISVVGGVDGLYIDDCLFKNTGGTLPGFGLDIEPNDGVLDNRNIFVTNCGFENNVGGMFGVYNNSYNVILNGLYVISGTQSAAVTRAKVTDKNPTVKILNSVISTLGVSNVSNLRLVDNEITNMVIEGVHSQCFDIQVIRCHFSNVLLDNLLNSLFTENIVKDTESTAVRISKSKNIDVTENYLENCGSETTNPMSIVTTSNSRITKNVFRKNNKLNKNCIVLNGGSNTGTIIEDNDFTNGCSEKEIGTPGPESVIGVNTLKNGEKSYHISTYLFAQTHAWVGRKMVAERTGLPFTLYECIQTGQNKFSWKAVT